MPRFRLPHSRGNVRGWKKEEEDKVSLFYSEPVETNSYISSDMDYCKVLLIRVSKLDEVSNIGWKLDSDLISVLARKFGVSCRNLVSSDPGQVVDKQEMMYLASQIQRREDAITELLHTRLNSNPKEFPF